MKKLKNLIIGFALVLCFAGSVITLSACKKTNKTANMSVNDIFAMGMVSATNYLSKSNSAWTLSTLPSEQNQATIIEYTKMFEGILSNGLTPTESDTTSADGEYGVYAKKLSLTLSGDTYVMYYNEVVEGTETEIDDDEIEQETTSFLYGKVVKGEIVYNVVGSREIESETKKDVTEYESELKLIFSPSELVVSNTKSINNIDVALLTEYVIIEQEAEDDEIEFEYTTKTATTNVKTVEIKFEIEDNKPELEIKVKENGSKVKYIIESDTNNRYSVKIKSKDNKVVYYIDGETWTFSEV